MSPHRRRAGLRALPLAAALALVPAPPAPGAPQPRPEAAVTPKTEPGTTDALRADLPQTDLDQLARLVDLPRRPLSARWGTRPLGAQGGFGPSDWELVAVLRFAPEDVAALLDACPPAGGAADPAPAWLPGGLAPPSGETRDAAALARPPLAGGVLLRAGDAWVLRLHTT